MLEKIKTALNNNPNVNAWNIRHEKTSGSQQYDLESSTEAVRQVSSEQYTIDVLCDSLNAEGEPSSGVGTVSILPGLSLIHI